MAFKVHPNFYLNGNSFSNKNELLCFSKEISEELFLFVSDFLNEEDTIKLQTSGSTGTPKVIEVRKEFMLNSALATSVFFNLKENSTALLCMNPKFIGAKMMLVRAMLLGWKLDIITPSLNPLKEVNKTYDFCAMVPMQVFGSLEELHKIKTLIIGGGTVSFDLKKALQKVPTHCFSTYGMTETVSHIAVRRITNEELRIENYSVFPNIIISKDKRNCLIITAPKIASEEIQTNDIVEIISDSEFKWLGRYDSIINSGGIKLIPEQIEEKLSEIIEQRFFISSLPDTILGEKVVLIVEGKENDDVILNKVKNLKSLSKYEVPKEVYFIPQFIETETKKIQRKKTLDLVQF
ncbi:MAG: AMP-binding protein [Flavobacteriaceae bacterium]|nr:AMP-binding protein [Flavobacteriaceae bacterium]